MQEGRTQKAARNVITSFINQGLTLILSLISRSVFIWGFGVGYLGINGLFGDILSLLSMADLGFNTAMVYSFYEPLAQKNYKKIAGLISFYRRVYHIIAIGITVVGLAIIPFLPKLIHLEYEVPYLNLYYLLSLSSVVASYLCVYRTSILYVDQKGYIVTRVTMLTNLAKTIFQIVSIMIWKNYTVYLAIGIGVTISNNVMASKLAQKEYPFLNEQSTISQDEKSKIYSNIGSVFLYKVSSVLLNATDNILISAIVNTVAVGLYSNYLMLQTKITAFFSLFFTSMTASIGNLIATEAEERRYEVFTCEQSISFIFSGIVIPCYVLLADDFIHIWLGKEYMLGSLITCAIGFNMYLSCVLQPLWSYREATGLYRKTKWVMVICAVENIVLSIILGRIWGVFGIIVASGISRLTTYVWYEPRLLFRSYFNQSEYNYYWDLLKNSFLIIGVISIMMLIWHDVIVDNYLIWISKAVVTGLSAMIIVLLFYRKTDGFEILVSRVKKSVRR